MKINVIPFRQEGTQMYAGIAPIKELLKIAKVDVWRQEDGQESGYQRAPESGRVGRIARYLQTDPKPLMPTSVLLAYRGTLNASGNGPQTIELPDNVTLWIVDGQHRIYGFKHAIEELGLQRLQDYVLPIIIVEFLTIEDEANQFRIINENMKKVRTDLARRILAIRAAELGRAGRRELRDSGRLWEATAVEILKTLTADPDSPWVGKIQSPNTRKLPAHVIRELSFTTSLKPIITERPYRNWPVEQLAAALKAYWKAWYSLIPEAFDNAQDYVLMKTPGVFSLHMLAYHVFEVLRIRGVTRPTVDDFKGILKDLGEYATAAYWEKGNEQGAAMAGSMKGFSILADAMQEELMNAGHTTE